jgi:hypothetical protein
LTSFFLETFQCKVNETKEQYSVLLQAAAVAKELLQCLCNRLYELSVCLQVSVNKRT